MWCVFRAKCVRAYVQMILRGVVLLCILVLPSRVAAYGSMFHHSFSVSLPRLTVREGISLLHGPERWANGVGLLVGLPPFHIRKVSTPLVVGGECLVQFEAKMPPWSGLQCDVKEVLWVAHSPKECRIRLKDQGCAEYALHLDARMVPFDSTELGVLLVLDVYTITPIEEETLQGIGNALPLSLSMCNQSPTARYKGLALYRKHVDNLVSSSNKQSF